MYMYPGEWPRHLRRRCSGPTALALERHQPVAPGASTQHCHRCQCLGRRRHGGRCRGRSLLHARPPKMVHPSRGRGERRKSLSRQGPRCPSTVAARTTLASAPRTMLLRLQDYEVHTWYLHCASIVGLKRVLVSYAAVRRRHAAMILMPRMLIAWSVRPGYLQREHRLVTRSPSYQAPIQLDHGYWSWCCCESSSLSNFTEYQLDSGIGTLYLGNRESNRWGLCTWLG
jgi:hypothetical protein